MKTNMLFYGSFFSENILVAVLDLPLRIKSAHFLQDLRCVPTTAAGAEDPGVLIPTGQTTFKKKRTN